MPSSFTLHAPPSMGSVNDVDQLSIMMCWSSWHAGVLWSLRWGSDEAISKEAQKSLASLLLSPSVGQMMNKY
jgi:hypothetical protein